MSVMSIDRCNVNWAENIETSRCDIKRNALARNHFALSRQMWFWLFLVIFLIDVRLEICLASFGVSSIKIWRKLSPKKLIFRVVKTGNSLINTKIPRRQERKSFRHKKSMIDANRSLVCWCLPETSKSFRDRIVVTWAISKRIIDCLLVNRFQRK